MKMFTDYLDEACWAMYEHTNWEYGKGDANKTVVIFHKEPLDEEEIKKEFKG